jgi:Protein phosphatase 2C
MTWKNIAASVPGTKHKKRALDCQDYAGCQRLENNVIIGAVSDGVGSVKYAKEGAHLAVETAISTIKSWYESPDDDGKKALNHDSVVSNRIPILILIIVNWCNDFIRIFWSSILPKLNTGIIETNKSVEACQDISKIESDLLNEVWRKVRERLEKEAQERNCQIDDFACTLLAFIATPYWLAALQMGDGFIVVREEKDNDDDYKMLFEPLKGEYYNETIPVTSSNSDYFKVKVYRGKYKFICASTDGLELAAIHLPEYTPYSLFFKPLEEYMKETPDPENENALAEFLDSEPVNRCTDDDKTLLLCFYED